MEIMKKLPDTEFEIMKVVWANDPPITTSIVMEQCARKWSASATITLMLRLVARGFLRTEKKGKVRSYYALVAKEDYLKFETDNFIEKFHDSSFTNLVNAMYGGKTLTDEDLDELLVWVKDRKKLQQQK
jgi:predicted transcriptional regulator